ncbi:MAG: radical SAM protein [Spirochaetes bacterium]|nr:MAG: radical SAM protein [Spirochaetota bacterium]
MKRYCILDCYVDEPACFGVPPFVSPYPRYLYGALLTAGAADEDIDYLTIETLRSRRYELATGYEMVFLIGGAVVPGKYLGHKIGTTPEIRDLVAANARRHFAIGGMVGHLLAGSAAPNLTPVKYDIEKFAFGWHRGEPRDECRTYGELARWAAEGAALCRRHPDFPRLICEIETARGCPRLQHCSFCAEGLTHGVEFRDEGDILREVDALIAAGISRFRLGRQADILQYKSSMADFRNGFPRPRVEPIRALFGELRARRDAGLITTLNIDNGNPGTIAAFPEESELILGEIVSALTPGDTLALGVESLDPGVIAKNNLKVDADTLVHVVRMVNEAGGGRVGGIPVLLPGVNLIHGLPGETAETFRINFEGLRRIMDEGLLLKRINIRSLLPFPGTVLYSRSFEPSPAIEKRYEYYKGRIRDEIDHAMLKAIYPAGTVLKDLFVMDRQFEYALARPIASYAITAKLHSPLERGARTDAMVIGHRERSLSALTLPVELNALPLKALELIPGIGRKRAQDIVLARPFARGADIMDMLKDVPEGIRKELLRGA